MLRQLEPTASSPEPASRTALAPMPGLPSGERETVCWDDCDITAEQACQELGVVGCPLRRASHEQALAAVSARAAASS